MRVLLRLVLMGLLSGRSLGGSETHLLSRQIAVPCLEWSIGFYSCFLFSDKAALPSLEKHVVLDYLGVPLLCILKLMSAAEQSVDTSSQILQGAQVKC